MSIAIKAKIDGLEPLLKKLEGLDAKVRKKALRKAVNDASKIITKAAKARVPTHLGLLKKSIGRSVRTDRGNGMITAKIGPRQNMGKAIGTYSRGRQKGGQKFADPAFYGHFVELGTGPRKSYPTSSIALPSKLRRRLGQAGKPDGRMMAKPFLRPALLENKAACESAMAAALKEAIGA